MYGDAYGIKANTKEFQGVEQRFVAWLFKKWAIVERDAAIELNANIDKRKFFKLELKKESNPSPYICHEFL